MKTPRNGFTLVELLTVIAIIAVLAGLVLASTGLVQKKAARSRAEVEIRALESALEKYKADNGDYPRDNVPPAADHTDRLNPRTQANPSVTTPAPTYRGATSFLYAELSGSGGRTVYFEFQPAMLNMTGTVVNFITDPFGYSYGYSTLGIKTTESGGSSNNYYNSAVPDLWSTGGSTASTGTGGWITNW